MERDVWIGVSGTVMNFRFGLGGGPTNVNRMAMTALRCIMNHSFISLDIFFVLLVHNNDDFIV